MLRIVKFLFLTIWIVVIATVVAMWFNHHNRVEAVHQAFWGGHCIDEGKRQAGLSVDAVHGVYLSKYFRRSEVIAVIQTQGKQNSIYCTYYDWKLTDLAVDGERIFPVD